MASCHDTTQVAVRPRSVDSSLTIRVALAGSPNVGKSTLFNSLTGLSQRTGNWTGKTVGNTTGYRRHDGRLLELTDLPGTYGLTAASAEEQSARDFLFDTRPDVTIVVVSAASLERGLYLAAELLELSTPIVVAVNMLDVAEAEGIRVEANVLSAALGVPVVPLVATKSEGVGRLLDAAIRLADGCDEYHPRLPEVDDQMEPLVVRLAELVTDCLPSRYQPRWVATKLLEGDSVVYSRVRDRLDPAAFAQIDRLLADNEDAVVSIASARYEWVGRMVRAAVVQPRLGVISSTERLDRVATHPVGGPLLLLAILGIIFWAVYQVAEPFIGLLEWVVGSARSFVHGELDQIAPWLGGIVADGLLGGAGTVLTLLPVVAVFFASMSFLEDVGYMARVAFVADRYMHKIGLHGKSFLPLFLGFGCNVPAVLGSRVIESRPARFFTIFLVGLVPCSGRLAVLVFIAAALFGASAPLVTWAMVAASLGVLAITGIVGSRFFMHGDRPAFIMELPLYHIPNWRTIAIGTWNSVREFVIRAGTLITLVSAIVWAVAALPSGDIQTGYLSMIGRSLEPIGRLMGFDWRLIVALLTSFVAKENTIATLGVLAASEGPGLASVLPSMLTPAAGLAFLTAQVFFVPCVGTVSAVYQETRSLRLTVGVAAYQLALAVAGGILVFQSATLFGLGG